MKKIEIVEKDKWLQYIMNEARYELFDECSGGLCVDAGCNVGDFAMNYGDRFDKYVCYDVLEENINECIKNTKNLGVEVEIHKLAVWSESDVSINVMAFEPWDTKDLQHFGNSGNVGCIEHTSIKGDGWKPENVIDLTRTISIDSIIEKYGTINLLKVDVECSEYEFLLGKDLSKVNYIVGECHPISPEKQKELIDWISNTHEFVGVLKNGSLGPFKLKGL